MWDYCGLWWLFPKYQVIQKLGNLSRGVFLSKGRILDVQYIYIPIQGPLNKTRDKPVPGIYTHTILNRETLFTSEMGDLSKIYPKTAGFPWLSECLHCRKSCAGARSRVSLPGCCHMLPQTHLDNYVYCI